MRDLIFSRSCFFGVSLKFFFALLTSCVFLSSSLLVGSSNTFLDYQNYDHGYCPDCNCAKCKCGGGDKSPSCSEGEDGEPSSCQGCGGNPGSCKKCSQGAKEGSPSCKTPDPCDPPATSDSAQCGISIWCLGIGVAAIAAAAVVIVSSNNGSVSNH